MAEQIVLNGTGTCPHCGKGVQYIPTKRCVTPVPIDAGVAVISGTGGPSGWLSDPDSVKRFMEVITVDCAICKRPIVGIQFYEIRRGAGNNEKLVYLGQRLIWPPVAARAPLPKGIPPHIAADYNEAALVITDSEKASAALSRRCLQSLLRDVGQTKSKDLSDQIEEVLEGLPGYLQNQVDAVRNIGNFAAHLQKSKATGEIIDVEPGEAEWNLDVLDLLFDFYYERPKIAQEKRDALNKKLAAVGKPPMK